MYSRIKEYSEFSSGGFVGLYRRLQFVSVFWEFK